MICQSAPEPDIKIKLCQLTFPNGIASIVTPATPATPIPLTSSLGRS
ncbi:unnamed protein product, partial [Staurois parvus]